MTQTADYYPSGLGINPLAYNMVVPYANQYLYNGKEQQNDFNNMRWLDYGARMYMPEIGRWSGVDPLGETSRRWSPYAYAMDNPVRFIDSDGMAADQYVKGGYGESILLDGSVGYSGNGDDIYNSDGQNVHNYNVTVNGHDSYLAGATNAELNEHIDNELHTDYSGEQAQEGPDRSDYFQFYPQKDEAKAYQQILKDQRFYNKEIAAYYVTVKGTNQKGILVLPWIGNDSESANPYIGMSTSDKTIKDDKGIIYTPFMAFHTHPDGVLPSKLNGDLAAMSYLNTLFPNMRGVIMDYKSYNKFTATGWSESHGSHVSLLNGFSSLFP